MAPRKKWRSRFESEFNQQAMKARKKIMKKTSITKRVEKALCDKYWAAVKAGNMRASEAAMSCAGAPSVARSLVRTSRKAGISDEKIIEIISPE